AFSIKQLARKLGLKKKVDIKQATLAVQDLASRKKLRQLANGNYAVLQEVQEAVGQVDHVSSRFAYIELGPDQPDIYVKASDLNSAVDGDTVRVSIYPTRRGDHPEGRVVEIIKRNRNRFVGRLELSPNFAFVKPDFRKIHVDFYIPPEHVNKAKAGDKVIVEVTAWGDGDRSPEAKVVEILGKAGENEAEIHSIMAEFGLPFRFPGNIIAEASAIEGGIRPQEIKQRRDFRDVTTFTIEPEDAKDFDDALAFRKLNSGNIGVGVHIADVTHYVRPDRRLEEEALDRATSVYLVDRTIPMLPERLSNELCSL